MQCTVGAVGVRCLKVMIGSNHAFKPTVGHVTREFRLQQCHAGPMVPSKSIGAVFEPKCIVEAVGSALEGATLPDEQKTIIMDTLKSSSVVESGQFKIVQVNNTYTGIRVCPWRAVIRGLQPWLGDRLRAVLLNLGLPRSRPQLPPLLHHRLQPAALEPHAQGPRARLNKQPVPSLLLIEALHQAAPAVPLGLAAQALHNHGRPGVQPGIGARERRI